MWPSLLAVALAFTARPAPARLHIALHFDGGASAAVEASIVEEAGRIWAPYGVALRDARQTHAPVSNEITLHVTIVERPDFETSDNALGSIPFHNAVPDPTISLYAGIASDLVSSAAPYSGSPISVSHWPTAYHDGVIARVLGRALAHEIGHYLLHTRGHSTSGLMRASQPILELMGVSDVHLGLSAADQATLCRALPAAFGEQG